MRLFIKAACITAGGEALNGYVINADAYAVAVFCQGEEFLFNNHPMLWDMNLQERTKLQAVLSHPSDPVFPLQYRTTFCDETGHLIAGEFQLNFPW